MQSPATPNAIWNFYPGPDDHPYTFYIQNDLRNQVGICPEQSWLSYDPDDPACNAASNEVCGTLDLTDV